MMTKENINQVNLKILACVQLGEKLSMSDDNILCIDKPSIFQGLRRWLGSNSRATTLENIIYVVTNTIQITNISIQEYKTNILDKDRFVNPVLPRYLTIIKGACNGLKHLARSYENDTSTRQIIMNNIQMLDDQCRTIEHALTQPRLPTIPAVPITISNNDQNVQITNTMFDENNE